MDRQIYRYCAVIGVDGMGNFNREAHTPALDRIFENGAGTYDALSMYPTISAENWGAMLLGVTPRVHGLTNESTDKYAYDNSAIPSVFRRIRTAEPDAVLVSCCNWDNINRGIIENDIGVKKDTADNDDALLPMILKRVSEKPKFLFVQLDDVDGAGHHFGYGTPDHLKAIERADSQVGAIYDAYSTAGLLDDTLFIVIADHGGFRHGHGGYTDSEKYVFLGASGKGIQKSAIGDAQTMDVAAIVLYALGLDMPAYDPHSFGAQIPNGLFPWYSGTYHRADATPLSITQRAAPAVGSENGLFSYIDASALKLGLCFDDEILDISGQCAFTEHGTIKYYSTGIFGACAELGKTGFADTKDLQLGADGFTAAFWLKMEPTLKDGAVILEMKTGSSVCTLLVCGMDIVLRMQSGEKTFEATAPVFQDLDSGWMHLAIVYDAAGRMIKVYRNDHIIRAVPLDDSVIPIPSAETFVLGSDLTYRRNRDLCPCIFRIDDLFLFGSAFSDDQVHRLGQYYGF